jgi:acyl-CoA synthetase (AMP-forming)/AMP-acid ligase II
LRDWGVGRGRARALLLPRAETVAAFFGVIQAGGCACVLEPRLKPEEIAARMARRGMKRLVVDRAPRLERRRAPLGAEVGARELRGAAAQGRRARAGARRLR